MTNNKKYVNKSGISLVILVITIIIIIILAGVSVYFMTSNHTIDSANEAALRTDIQAIKDSYEILMEEYNFEKYGSNHIIDSEKFEDIIPEKYKDSFRADENGIYYFGNDEYTKNIAKDMGIIIE